MPIMQLSVFLENRAGRLHEILSLLESGGVNIRALTLADKAEYGILRLIVDDPSKALSAAKEKKFSVSETPVIAVETEDKPGGLTKILRLFIEHAINIEYSYACAGKTGDKALVIFRVDDPARAETVLSKNNIRTAGQDTVCTV